MTKTITVRLEEQLQKMKFKVFLYNAHRVKVLSWKHDGNYCTVATSLQWISREHDEVLKILQNDFLEVEGEDAEGDDDASLTPAVTEAKVIPQLQLKALAKCDDLVDALMRAADVVEHNKDFIPQAASITNIADTVVDIAKVQIDAYRLARDIHRNRD